MIQWLIIAMMVILGMFFLKVEHKARKLKVMAIILLVFLLYLSITHVFSSDKIDLKSPSGMLNAVYVYFGWIGQTAGSLWDIGTDTVHTVGNAIKVNNSTK